MTWAVMLCCFDVERNCRISPQVDFVCSTCRKLKQVDPAKEVAQCFATGLMGTGMLLITASL